MKKDFVCPVVIHARSVYSKVNVKNVFKILQASRWVILLVVDLAIHMKVYNSILKLKIVGPFAAMDYGFKMNNVTMEI